MAPLTEAQVRKIFDILDQILRGKFFVFNPTLLLTKGLKDGWDVSRLEIDGDVLIIGVWFHLVHLNEFDGYHDVTYTFRIFPDGSIEEHPTIDGNMFLGE